MRAIQDAYLARVLSANAQTRFGREHGFDGVRDREDFRRRVPVRDYEALRDPWLTQVEQGEPGILVSEPVLHLHPTSGTAGGRKLIPYTAGLRADFGRGLASWLNGLYSDLPALDGGSAYWAITPPMPLVQPEGCRVPVRFAEDAEYLPSDLAMAVGRSMALPSGVGQLTAVDNVLYATLRFLLADDSLRLISVWSPTWLQMLLERAETWRERLLADIGQGGLRLPVQEPEGAGRIPESHLKPRPDRAQLLRPLLDQAAPDYSAVWPQLRLISCWTEGSAARFVLSLDTLFPGIPIQPKGLLSTEAMVSYPDTLEAKRGCRLATECHFFEFLDQDTGLTRFSDEVREGKAYSVIVTTAGGLYRYQTHDVVQIASTKDGVPYLNFVGRDDRTVDLVGEKLNETVVEEAVRLSMKATGLRSGVQFLVPDVATTPPAYVLLVERDRCSKAAAADLAARLDGELRRDFQYDQARGAGQLGAVRFHRLTTASSRSVWEYLFGHKRPGDLKASVLQGDPELLNQILTTHAP
ncbi:MAG: hypothetical protein ACI9W4_002569 [Rhodothermales bacterium]